MRILARVRRDLSGDMLWDIVGVSQQSIMDDLERVNVWHPSGEIERLADHLAVHELIEHELIEHVPAGMHGFLEKLEAIEGLDLSSRGAFIELLVEQGAEDVFERFFEGMVQSAIAETRTTAREDELEWHRALVRDDVLVTLKGTTDYERFINALGDFSLSVVAAADLCPIHLRPLPCHYA